MRTSHFTTLCVKSVSCLVLLLAVGNCLALNSVTAKTPYSLHVTTSKGSFDIQPSTSKATYDVQGQKLTAVFRRDGTFTIDNLPAGSVLIKFVATAAYFTSKREAGAGLDLEYRIVTPTETAGVRKNAPIGKANQSVAETMEVRMEVLEGASVTGRTHWSTRNGADFALDDWEQVH